MDTAPTTGHGKVLGHPKHERRGLSPKARLATIAAIVLIALSFLFPLWALHLRAPQYPETLNLYVYAYKFDGSHNPALNDLEEINTLNHYIGMAEIHESEFAELKVLPLALGGVALLLLAGVLLNAPWIVAVGTSLLALTGFAGLGSAYMRLYSYGHHLSPDAPLKVAPFTPPLLGTNRLVNFMTTGMFGIGGFMLMLAGGLLLYGLWDTYRHRPALKG